MRRGIAGDGKVLLQCGVSLALPRIVGSVMRFNWVNALTHWFAAPTEPQGRARLNISKFALGVCPRCRGLRGVASLRCSHCGSPAPVTEDA
jgi:hypothetical protein